MFVAKLKFHYVSQFAMDSTKSQRDCDLIGWILDVVSKVMNHPIVTCFPFRIIIRSTADVCILLLLWVNGNSFWNFCLKKGIVFVMKILPLSDIISGTFFYSGGKFLLITFFSAAPSFYQKCFNVSRVLKWIPFDLALRSNTKILFNSSVIYKS
jgi:hypothetical protein